MADFFALDIGSTIIKVVALKGKRVRDIGMVPNPLGVVGWQVGAEQRQVLVTAIKSLLSSLRIKTKKVVVGVPESLVYSKIMSFPVISTAELASAIRWQADQDIPLAHDKMELSWAIIDKPVRRSGDEKMDVAVVAVSKETSQGLVGLMDLCGLEPLRAENDGVALVRWANSTGIGGNVLVLDVGASSTKMVYLSNSKVRFIYQYPVAGLALTRAIMQEFGLNMLQAEQYKGVYGLDSNQLEGRLAKAMDPVLSTLLLEISKIIATFGADTKTAIERVVVVGGSGYTKSILPKFSEKIGLEVVVADVFAGYELDSQIANYSLGFAVALGLAIDER